MKQEKIQFITKKDIFFVQAYQSMKLVKTTKVKNKFYIKLNYSLLQICTSEEIKYSKQNSTKSARLVANFFSNKLQLI